MIRHIDPDNTHLALSCISGHPLLAVAIAARAGCVQDEMDFWLCEEGDTVLAWLCRNGTTFYITGESRAADELAEFVTTVGYERVMTDLALPLSGESPMVAVDWQGEAPILPELPEDCRIVYLTPYRQGLSAVDFARFQLDCGALSDSDEVQRYAVSLSHAVRAEKGAAAAIVREGNIIAGAAVNQMIDGRAILGAVAVLPACRGQGLATSIVQIGAALSMQLAARPYLCCRAQLQPLYEGAGFTVIAPLRQYRKDN